ncbi:hypothetical protein NI25_17545 [Streptomyces sp. CCM_MD2014]|nr:hypothetical protein NI25_17545 [Streptomyces sp. CCM_MD2014]
MLAPGPRISEGPAGGRRARNGDARLTQVGSKGGAWRPSPRVAKRMTEESPAVSPPGTPTGYARASRTVSTREDARTSSMPPTMLFIAYPKATPCSGSVTHKPSF